MVRLGEGAYVGLGLESGFATNGTGSSIEIWLPATDATSQITSERTRLDLGDIYTRADIVEGYFKNGQRKVSGTLTFQCLYDFLPDIIRSFLGNAGTISGAGPYTYTYTSPFTSPGSSSHFMTGSTTRCMTIEVFNGGNATDSVFYQGCMITELQIRLEGDAFVEITASFMGRRVQADTKSTPVVDVSTLLVTPTAQAGGSLTLNNTSYKPCYSATITLRNGLDYRFDISGIETELPMPSAKPFAGLEAEFEVDDDLFVTTFGDDPENNLLDVANSIGISQGTNQYGFTVNYQKLRLNNPSEPRPSGVGPVRFSGSFDGVAPDATSTGLLSIVLKNAQSAYTLT